MSATCLYIFQKGDKTGQYCPTHPMYGNYCSKHKHHDPNLKDRPKREGFLERAMHQNLKIEKMLLEQELKERKELERKESPQFILDPFRQKYLINWESCIVFKSIGEPLGKLFNGIICPLAGRDIEFLVNNKVIISKQDYHLDFGFFFDEYYPENLETTFTEINNRIELPYPFAIDTRTKFLYKYDEITKTFDFYRIYKHGCDIKNLENQPLSEYLQFILNIINLYGLNVSQQRQPPTEHKAEPEPDTFNLQRQVECKFYRLENKDTCIVCLEKCNVYYTETCEKPHLCCQNCWKTNLQNRCPVCRINIYN